jgi:hydrogenase-4 component F
MLALVLLLVPAVTGCVAAATPWRRWVGWLCTASLGFVLVTGVVLATRVVHRPALSAFSGVLRVDALSAFMVIVIGAIGLLAVCQSGRYLEREVASGHSSARRATLYAVLVQGFITAMLLAVVAGNVGVMWVAVEATTIITTFLVGYRRTRGALEASWKYVIICSVGIALAFLGTVLVYLAALHAGTGTHVSLEWTSLMRVSHHLNPGVMRLAFALLVLGYGTKVGLAPMHSWLPDAHSQAPAPVSALMSGVLLTVAFYVLLRFKAIADGALGVGFSRTLFVTVGLLSLMVAASLLLSQRDYKRMLAYHSVEHMGLIALGAAAGTPLAIAAVLLHVLGHGLAKAVLFLASGEILLVEGTTEIDQVKALLARRPALGGIFAFGLVALLGLPPFSLFISELNMLRAEVHVGLGWVAAISLVLMAVIFGSVMSHGRHMLFGARPDGETVHKSPLVVTAPLVGALVACGAIGVLAWPLDTLLRAAAMVVVR